MYDSVLAVESTCLVSSNRQWKLKAGKMKKQASTEEMTASVEEAKGLVKRGNRETEAWETNKTGETERS